MEGQNWALSERVDSRYFCELAAENQTAAEELVRERDVSHSALLPVLKQAGFVFGAATSMTSPSVRMAVYGALHDSISDEYNDQIRTLLERGTLGE